ncbi:unnamed protein product [Macrosiphum euphorbiae]|uniref:Uncharacterized protein n=1 Tax=Macrosiphum euphorbiae TaxID=13131 RepID=A0AAV0W3N6_9HEMI|nr:unnamed protein product [Macrosiphum euphorbiae]
MANNETYTADDQFDCHLTPVRVPLLDSPAGDIGFAPEEAAESMTVVSTALAKTDGDGLEPAVTEQFDCHLTPVRVPLLDSPVDDIGFISEEAAESMTVVSTALAKTDGDGLEPAVTEQFDCHLTPVRVPLLDSPAGDIGFAPEEAAESMTVVSTALAKTDGEGLEPAVGDLQSHLNWLTEYHFTRET